FSPILPWITVLLLLVSIAGIAWDPSQRAGLYFGVPFMLLCYVYYYIRFKKW
ncbi:amino acid permease, partial [Streptococcus pyogenes]